jgi:hypothetical protein
MVGFEMPDFSDSAATLIPCTPATWRKCRSFSAIDLTTEKFFDRRVKRTGKAKSVMQ